MDQPLKNCVITFSGNFEISGTSSIKPIMSTILPKGGKIATKLVRNTTHLVCSREDWINQVRMVKAALQQETVSIVSMDWLVDSIVSTRREEHDYLWSTLEMHGKMRSHAEWSALQVEFRHAQYQKLERGCKVAAKDLGCDDYHVYHDYTEFEYMITLYRVHMRAYLDECSRDSWCLKLFEHNFGPSHGYICSATYSAPDGENQTFHLTPMRSTYQEAFGQWCRFFRGRTGVDWLHRFSGQQTQALEGIERSIVLMRGGVLVGDVPELTWAEKAAGKKKEYFWYTLPDWQRWEAAGVMVGKVNEVYGGLPEVGGMPTIGNNVGGI